MRVTLSVQEVVQLLIVGLTGVLQTEFTLPLGESGRRPGEGGAGQRIRRVSLVQERPSSAAARPTLPQCGRVYKFR